MFGWHYFNGSGLNILRQKFGAYRYDSSGYTSMYAYSDLEWDYTLINYFMSYLIYLMGMNFALCRDPILIIL